MSPFTPTFDPQLFGRHGKVMDSWQSQRHNTSPYEEVSRSVILELAYLRATIARYGLLGARACDGVLNASCMQAVFRLAKPVVPCYAVLSTMFHDGNQVLLCPG